MNDSVHNRLSEELAAYMLGALEPGEAAEFERHLAGCEHCQTELRWFDPAVQLLPETVERQEPPPRLREALMAEVRADVRPAPAQSRRWGLGAAMGVAGAAPLVAGVGGY